ncbi:MAG: MaoC family dehydratase [Candidatus Helarchaeota archaeon]
MPTFSNIQVGDEIPSYIIKISRQMYKQYNRLVHEINPLHFNKTYATSLGYKDIVVAGVFTYSFFVRPLLNWVDDILAIKKVQIRYHRPVYIEDEITQGAIITKKYVKDGLKYVECDLWVKNQNNELITSGSALVNLKS